MNRTNQPGAFYPYRRAVAGFCASVMLALVAYPAETARNVAENRQLFTEFLVKRPAIEGCIFTRSNFSMSEIKASAGGSQMTFSHLLLYYATTDGTNFITRQLDNDVDASRPIGTNTTFFVGRASNLLWQAGKYYVIEHLTGTPQSNRIGSSNNLESVTSIGFNILTRALGFGLVDQNDSLITINGTSFEVKLRGETRAIGDFVVERGLVTSARYTIRGFSGHCKVSYEYWPNPGVPGFLPNRFTASAYDSSGQFMHVFQQMEFRELRIAEKLLPIDHFKPDRFRQSGGTRPTKSLLYTNGLYYELTKAGLKPITPTRPPTSAGLVRLVFYTLSLASVIAGILFFRSTKHKQQQTKPVI